MFIPGELFWFNSGAQSMLHLSVFVRHKLTMFHCLPDNIRNVMLYRFVMNKMALSTGRVKLMQFSHYFQRKWIPGFLISVFDFWVPLDSFFPVDSEMYFQIFWSVKLLITPILTVAVSPYLIWLKSIYISFTSSRCHALFSFPLALLVWR